MNKSLKESDFQIHNILKKESTRQQDTLTLIPSENYPSRAVREAEGSILINKYAEGYPGRRYYQGCQFADEIEELAIERARKLFKGEHINVQPHSGTQANIAVYQALLNPGDTILSLKLCQGGHLSHGNNATLPHTHYRIIHYGIDKDSEIFDYQEIRQIAKKHRPRLIIVGASAYPRSIDFAPWREIADEVEAYLLADVAHIIGLIAAGLHPDPIPYADVITATTHKTLRGPRGGLIICRKEYASLIDKAIFPATQGGPFMHTIAAKAICFKEAMEPQFKEYQAQVISNARELAKTFLRRGFRLISGGTDNHLLLIDLSNKNITGKEAAIILEEAGIVTNRNSVPFDTKPVSITSGIRPGTPALTTRGMKEPEMKLIAEWTSKILDNPKQENIRRKIREQVKELCREFPIYVNSS